MNALHCFVVVWMCDVELVAKRKTTKKEGASDIVQVKDNHNKKDVAIVMFGSDVEASEVKVEVVGKQRVEEEAPGFGSRLISSVIDIEVKRGMSSRRGVELCFVVAKKDIPTKEEREGRGRPEGGCHKVSFR